jgi:hypothetical protein
MERFIGNGDTAAMVPSNRTLADHCCSTTISPAKP